MGVPVLILGESGSGKSASLRNFAEDEAVIYNVAGKPLPFRKRMNRVADNVSYDKILSNMGKGNSKVYVIDDSQYLMAFELFDKVKEKGYEKFTSIAVNFKNLVSFVTCSMPPDAIVYFLHHTEIADGGRIKAKTVGKMLDSQLTLEGLFSIVLYCTIEQGRHIFVTQSDGTISAKSPMEMFDYKIDNDLKAVDTAIRNYYNLGGNNND